MKQLNNKGATNEGNSGESHFIYVESNLMKAIKEETSLIYVEVPNEQMLERLEKGIKEIYLQKTQIVVGFQSNSFVDKVFCTLIGNTKFVPVTID